MAKTNGTKGKGDRLRMGGTIHLGLREEDFQAVVSGKEATIDFDGIEVTLQIERAKKNVQLELTPWFELNHSTLLVDNHIRRENKIGCASLAGFIEAELIESEKRSLSLALSPEQAVALARVLMTYAKSWEAFDALLAEPARA